MGIHTPACSRLCTNLTTAHGLRLTRATGTLVDSFIQGIQSDCRIVIFSLSDGSICYIIVHHEGCVRPST